MKYDDKNILMFRMNLQNIVRIFDLLLLFCRALSHRSLSSRDDEVEYDADSFVRTSSEP
jgi:hypothetical protein